MPGGPRQHVSEDIRLMVAKLIPQAARHQYTVALAIQQERDECAKRAGNYLMLRTPLDVPRIVECEEAIRNPKDVAEKAA